MKKILAICALAGAFAACSAPQNKETKSESMEMKNKADEFASFKLTSKLDVLSEKEKQMLPVLFQAAQIMDDLFWQEAWGDKSQLLSEGKDEYTRKFININYGP